MSSVVIVDYKHEKPVTREDLKAASAKLGNCLQTRGIQWQNTFVSSDGLRQMCVFKAEDAERVRDAFRESGVAFEKVWTATEPWKTK
jgi:hypothetical protein